MQIHLKIVAIIVVCLLYCSQDAQALQCLNGQPILTRINNNNTFSLRHQCLCPIDYLGPGCKHHRGIKCYLTKKSINPMGLDESNFAQQITVQMQVNAECYIEQKPAGKKKVQGKEIDVQYYMYLLAYMVKRKSFEGNLDYELQNSTSGEEIIWANNTDLFYSNGRLKYVEGYQFTLDEQNQKVMSIEDEKNILGKYKPLKFVYESNFLGFPVSDSKFYVFPRIIRPTQNRIIFEKQTLKFVNYDDFIRLVNQTASTSELAQAQEFFKDLNLQDLLSDNLYDKVKEKVLEAKDKVQEINQNKILPYFKTTVTIEPRQAAEFKNIRLEVSLLQYYLADLQVEALSVNGIEFIMPVAVPGVAQAKVYSVNFNKKETPRIVYFLVFALLLGLGWLVYYFQNKKHRHKINKIKKHVQQMEDEIAWK